MTWEVSPSDSFISSLKPGVYGCLRYALHLKIAPAHCLKKVCLGYRGRIEQRYRHTRFTEGKAELLLTEDLSETFCLVTAWKCHMEGKVSGEMESQRRKVNKHSSDAGLETLEMHGKLHWHFPGLDRVRNHTEARDMCGRCPTHTDVTHCDIRRIIFNCTVIWPCWKPHCSTILDNIFQNTQNPVNNTLFRTCRRMISKSSLRSFGRKPRKFLVGSKHCLFGLTKCAWKVIHARKNK